MHTYKIFGVRVSYVLDEYPMLTIHTHNSIIYTDNESEVPMYQQILTELVTSIFNHIHQAVRGWIQLKNAPFMEIGGEGGIVLFASFEGMVKGHVLVIQSFVEKRSETLTVETLLRMLRLLHVQILGEIRKDIDVTDAQKFTCPSPVGVSCGTDALDLNWSRYVQTYTIVAEIVTLCEQLHHLLKQKQQHNPVPERLGGVT